MTPLHRPHRPRYLTAAQAGRVYDRIGRVQDLQAIYEHPAVHELLAHGDFEQADTVFELGYGTAALARRLLDRHLPSRARYAGVDVSPHMYDLARQRLAGYAPRVELQLSDGSLRLPYPDGSFDRFVAAYVLDLLNPADIDLALSEAQRLLTAGGLVCLTSLTYGATIPARLVTRVWRAAWAARPELVGGCRPLRLADHLDPDVWRIGHHAVVTAFGVSSEVAIAHWTDQTPAEGGTSR